MANCIRGGNHYKRHQFKDNGNGRGPLCIHCGQSQIKASRDRDARRESRRLTLGHPPMTGEPGGNAHDRRVAERASDSIHHPVDWPDDPDRFEP